jgi:molybdate transport system substrate-binding protein
MPSFRNTAAAGLGWLGLVWLLAPASPAYADYPVAPDVVVFCEPTLRHAVTDVGALWRSQTGIHVRVFTSPTWALLAQIAHHARDDVLIGEDDANAAAAAKQQLIKPTTMQQVGRNQLVVAALGEKTDGANTGSSPAAAALASIAGKQPIAIVDPWAAAAGADTKKALEALGVWQKLDGKSVGVVGTADAAYLLTQGHVKLAIVYATDVAANPALTVADRLPASSHPPIVYWVAETTHALSPNTTKFIEFLHTAGARQQLRADGLEISP